MSTSTAAPAPAPAPASVTTLTDAKQASPSAVHHDVSWRAEELAAVSSLETASCFLIDGVPHVRYFAIGSMINPTSLRYRGIVPIVSQPAILRGYQLVFQGAGGMASIMPDPDAHFHGVLHTITAKQMADLDTIESVYGRMDVKLELYDGSTIIGSVYKFDPTRLTFTTHNPPSERYIDIITRGCAHYGVHKSHIDWLHSQQQTPRKKVHEMIKLPEPPEGVTITKKELSLMDGLEGRPLAWSVNSKCLRLRLRPGITMDSHPALKFSVARLTQFKLGGKEVALFYSRMLYEPMYPEASTYDEMHPDHKSLIEDVYAHWQKDTLPHMEVFARLMPDDTTSTTTTATTTTTNTTTTETTTTTTTTGTNAATTTTITQSTNTTTQTISTTPTPSTPSTSTSGSTFLIDGAPHVRYFAIGSMVNPTSMRYRSLTPISSTPGILYGYRLIFSGLNGMANIVPDPQSHFHGVVHVLTQEQMTRLDQLEAAYGRSDVEITLYDNSRIIASVYQLDPKVVTKGIDSALPSQRYLDLLISGCKHHGVHESHITWLQSQPSTQRPELHELQLLPEPPEGEYITEQELHLMDGSDGRPIGWSINGKVLQLITPIEKLPHSLQWLMKRMQAELVGREYIYWLSKILYDPKYPESSSWSDLNPMHRLQLEHHFAKHILSNIQHFKVIARVKGTEQAHDILKNGNHVNGKHAN